jgi:uncharacterized protein YjiS (DUF1127 family)
MSMLSKLASLRDHSNRIRQCRDAQVQIARFSNADLADMGLKRADVERIYSDVVSR